MRRIMHLVPCAVFALIGCNAIVGNDKPYLLPIDDSSNGGDGGYRQRAATEEPRRLRAQEDRPAPATRARGVPAWESLARPA